jgi:hypothetical protein
MGFLSTFRITQAESSSAADYQREHGVIFWASDWLPAVFDRSRYSRLPTVLLSGKNGILIEVHSKTMHV